MTRVTKLLSVALLCLALLAPALPPAFAGDGSGSDTKKSFKKLGEKMKKFGKEVGEAGKEAGQEIADAAKKVFYKGKKVSEPLLRETQKATKDFWGDVIRGKEKTADELREENEKLKRELEEEDDD